jgi:hypothetical protein
LLLEGAFFTLKPGEALMVKPQIPHAVMGGRGTIEHFILRMPAMDGRQTTEKVPQSLLMQYEARKSTRENQIL